MCNDFLAIIAPEESKYVIKATELTAVHYVPATKYSVSVSWVPKGARQVLN